MACAEITLGSPAANALALSVQGCLQAGLSAAQIERLGRAGHAVTKVSRRDMGFVVAADADGATTVAAPMRIAALAGIRVFPPPSTRWNEAP